MGSRPSQVRPSRRGRGPPWLEALLSEQEQKLLLSLNHRNSRLKELCVLLRKMWPFFCATPPPTPSIRRNGPMTPEKTHFQNPGCWPAREEGAGVAATASARGGLAPLSTETAFVCHSPIFSTRIFPLFLLPILFLRVSQSLFTASLQLEPLGKR